MIPRQSSVRTVAVVLPQKQLKNSLEDSASPTPSPALPFGNGVLECEVS